MANGSTIGGSPLATGMIALGMFIGGARMLKDALNGLDQALGNSPSKAPLAPENGNAPDGRCGNSRDPKCQVYSVRRIEDRVGHIAHLIRMYSENPQFVIKARQIVSQKCEDHWCVEPRDYAGEIKALWTYVKANLRYVRDHATKDTYFNPNANLKSGGADCDDFVITFCALARAIGYETALVVVQTKGAPDFNHIYCMVNANPRGRAKWLPIDASVDWVSRGGQKVPNYPGWEAPAGMIQNKRIFRV